MDLAVADSSGLYYDRARWYDPSTGRFLSEDPAPAGAIDQLNLYRYAGNNPLKYADPTGTNAVGHSSGGYSFGSSNRFEYRSTSAVTFNAQRPMLAGSGGTGDPALWDAIQMQASLPTVRSRPGAAVPIRDTTLTFSDDYRFFGSEPVTTNAGTFFRGSEGYWASYLDGVRSAHRR